jgi:hypothetical protein
MDCPANIEHYTYDDDGAPISVEAVPCTGTLEGPVPNPATGNVEALVMDNDGNTGRNWYCATCGQTTVISDVRDAGTG